MRQIETKSTKNEKANKVLEGKEEKVKLSWEEIVDILNEPLDDQVLSGEDFEVLNWMNKLAGQHFELPKESESKLISDPNSQKLTAADLFMDALINYHAQLKELGITETAFEYFLDKFKSTEKEKLEDEDGRRAVIKELVRDSLGKKNGEIPEMFPEEYAEFSHSLGDFPSKQELRFPTSGKGRVDWHANCINIDGRNLILSAGVPATISPNSKEMTEYLRSILIYQPSIIIAIAKFEEDIEKNSKKNEKQEVKEERKRVNGLFKYIKPGFYGEQRQYQIKTKLTTDEKQIELTITDLTTKESHTTKFINIQTDDNKPICFNFRECQAFLSLYDSLPLEKSQPIMIHCMSGIGRTAFFAMLFLLMDTISQRYDFEKSLLKSLQEPVNKHDLERLLIFREGLNLINKIRKFRPFLQDKTHQGYNIIKQLIVLLLVKRQFIYQGMMKNILTDLSFDQYSPTSFRKFTQKEIEQDTIQMNIGELQEIFDELKKSGHDGSIVNVIYNTFIGNSSIFNNKTKLDELKSLLDKAEKYETAAAFNVDCLKIINQFKDWESNGKKYGKVVELIKSYCERRELKPEIKSEQCSII